MKKPKNKKLQKHKKLPARNTLLAYFSYDPITGILTRHKTGKEVGWTDDKGYRRFRFKHVTYCVHRVVYYMYHGKDPAAKVIDHCNGDTSDNRISNLRCVTHRTNLLNTAACRAKDGVPVDLHCDVNHAENYALALPPDF